jgi:hypothetical protein
MLETPFTVRRRQRGGRNVVQVSSTACEMDALRDRIRSQSRALAEHIARRIQKRSPSLLTGPRRSP